MCWFCHCSSPCKWRNAAPHRQFWSIWQLSRWHRRKKILKYQTLSHDSGTCFRAKCGNPVHGMLVFYNDLHRFGENLCSLRLPTCSISFILPASSWNEARLKNVTPWKWPSEKCLWNVESGGRATLLVAEGSGRSGVQYLREISCVA